MEIKHKNSRYENWLIPKMDSLNFNEETKLYLIHHNRAIEYEKEKLAIKKRFEYYFNKEYLKVPFEKTKVYYKELLKNTQENINYYEDKKKNTDNEFEFEWYNKQQDEWIEKKRKIKRLIELPKGFKNELNISKAKEFPIEQLLDFNKYGFIKCIFHTEKTPSMRLDKKRNKAHCFAGCGDFDSIDIFQKINNVSFSDAVRKLN